MSFKGDFMYLRRLELKDAPFMYEWMQDPTVVEFLQANFASKTENDCVNFIKNSWIDKQNCHLAISDEKDVYQGTVSLKNISDSSAEFAITIRSSAMGKGYSQFGMSEIIRKGINELKLHNIYWCVSPDNRRAVRFYDKNGYQRIPYAQLDLNNSKYTSKEITKYLWYIVTTKD